MAETYHGVEIPEDIWREWTTPFEDISLGFREGVRRALRIAASGEADRAERDRLEALSEGREEAEQAAFEEKNKDQPWMQRRQAFRKAMEEKTNGAS